MKPTPEPGLLLAFGAHPDDIEFGCGGVIARETQAGRKAHFVVCSRGEAATNGTPRQRTAEAQQGAKLLGAALEFLDLGGDAHFEVRIAHVLKLAAIIRRLRPEIVLAPTTVENQHPDHVVLGRMVRDAARLARYGGVKELRSRPPHAIGALLFYSVAVEGDPAGVQPVWIDVSAAPVMEAWIQAMRAHESQAKTRPYSTLQLARAGVNGARCGVPAAIALYPNDPLVFDSLASLRRTARRF
ncbi:MAG: PIG-L family deacetylase [Opitutaceae bacterium]|nr:PIG-L family deacetylase [Opitutaceae bacterium]